MSKIFRQMLHAASTTSLAVLILSGWFLHSEPTSDAVVFWHECHRWSGWTLFFSSASIFILRYWRQREVSLTWKSSALIYVLLFTVVLWNAWIGLYLQYESGVRLLVDARSVDWGDFWMHALPGYVNGRPQPEAELLIRGPGDLFVLLKRLIQHGDRLMLVLHSVVLSSVAAGLMVMADRAGRLGSQIDQTSQPGNLSRGVNQSS